MSYPVLLQRLAEVDLQEAYSWAAQYAPSTAAHWLQRFQEALDGLGDNPQRWPLAAESKKVAMELREYCFGKKPNVYRVIFTITATTVRILRIRKAQRRHLTRKQIEEADLP